MALRVLVLVQGYPDADNRYNLAYVHTRLLGYLERGVSVSVLNFGASKDYVYEGVSVITESTWVAQKERYPVVIAHAPNLRNHFRFLRKYGVCFKRWIFFFHGHEVLNKQNYYPAPYAYHPTQHRLVQMADKAYDFVKLKVLRPTLEKWLKQGHLELVFVSRWMQEAFFENVKARSDYVLPHAHIISNAVHPLFLKHQWQHQPPSNADVITIRPLDNSKYAIDQVCEIAKYNPNLRFHIFGQGNYFQHYLTPKNVVWFNRFLKPEEMMHLLPRYRCALMPTRLDAQGVMMCELASYGMPMITSDLPICREMLSAFERTHFLDVFENSLEPLEPIIQRLEKAPPSAFQPFSYPALIAQEIQLITQESS